MLQHFYMKQLNITKKQLEILLLLYRFRFLDTPTIQLYLKHKLPTRIQQWLKKLKDKGYIHQFYDKESFVNRTKPAIYCLSFKSRKILETQKECEPYILSNLYREKTRSDRFKTHCNDIAKISYRLEQQAITEGKTLKFYTMVDLNGYMHFPQPLPDGYISVRKKDIKTKRYFIELIDEKIPKRFIKSKIRRYSTCSEGDWDEQTKVEFPIVLLVAQTPYEQKKITRCTRIVMNEEYYDLKFYITIKEKLLAKVLPTDLWKRIEND